MTKPAINLWANFLNNEKLSPKRVGPELGKLIDLCQKLSDIRRPIIRPYPRKLESRRLVVETAMDMEFDLSAIKYRGKIAMARSLLDMWNKVYQERFGSIVGTASARESARRDVKTRLAGRPR